MNEEWLSKHPATSPDEDTPKEPKEEDDGSSVQGVYNKNPAQNGTGGATTGLEDETHYYLLFATSIVLLSALGMKRKLKSK